jgi:hypothetical protein
MVNSDRSVTRFYHGFFLPGVAGKTHVEPSWIAGGHAEIRTMYHSSRSLERYDCGKAYTTIVLSIMTEGTGM